MIWGQPPRFRWNPWFCNLRYIAGSPITDDLYFTSYGMIGELSSYVIFMSLTEVSCRLVAVDHCSAEGVGIHATRYATRFEAPEPIRQGIRTRFGAYARKIADGLLLRHDPGSQYMSDDSQEEIRFLVMEGSPAFVREPGGMRLSKKPGHSFGPATRPATKKGGPPGFLDNHNGCAKRFIRTLKENLLWVSSYRTIGELQQALHRFKDNYNNHRLIERHGHRPFRSDRSRSDLSWFRCS